MHILFIPFLASLAKESSSASLKIGLHLQLEQQAKIAAAGVEVMRRLDSPRAVCDCIAALVHGDLTAAVAPGSGLATGAPEFLLPLVPPPSAPLDLVRAQPVPHVCHVVAKYF